MSKLNFETWDALRMLCNGDQMADTLTELQKEMLKNAANPNCRYCDGSGIFYGNVTACGCACEEKY